MLKRRGKRALLSLIIEEIREIALEGGMWDSLRCEAGRSLISVTGSKRKRSGFRLKLLVKARRGWVSLICAVLLFLPSWTFCILCVETRSITFVSSLAMGMGLK